MNAAHRILITLLILTGSLNAQMVYTDPNTNAVIESNIYYQIDPSNTISIKQAALSNDFKLSNKAVPNFGTTNASVWLKMTILNKTDVENLILQVNQPIIDQIDFYTLNPQTMQFDSCNYGEYKPFAERTYQLPEYLYDIKIHHDSARTVFIKVRCKENMQLPIQIGTRISVLNKSVKGNIASGIYIGIMICMILYNLFIYATLRDKSYILYSLYIILILLTQTSLQGLTYQLLWPNNPWLATYSPFLFPALVGVLGLEFFKNFLKIKERYAVAYKLSFVFLPPYFVSIILGLSGYFNVSFMMVEATAGSVSLFMLVIAYLIYRRGFSEARYFLIGWSVFLLGICIYVLKDFEVLPYNGFTRYTMHFGSAVEVILLSFALADRINILKQEKEESQAEALSISQQNQKLITEQNILLEQKVHERTIELEDTNEELNVTLTYLKDTQSQLVNAEKMASLGQLTAGIAHEINNPINFVSSNLRPLKMDVLEIMDLISKYESITPDTDLNQKLTEIQAFRKKIDLDYLKEEINHLLVGIEDGARRTAEIVAGLKNFSRLDESEVKEANINEGIQSTLVLIRSSIPKEVEVITKLGELPLIECYPGKLNQVFMNVLSNSIYALKHKQGDGKKQLIITTYEEGDKVIARFEDTGVGMSKEIKEKIFEPFFTTKEVGEGTGLGMSIVFKIVESHHARLDVESEAGKGTILTLILNKRLS